MTTPSKHSHSSFSLPLLGATTTIGFWLVWRRFHKGNKIFPSIDSVTPFKFELCKPKNSRQTSINQDKDSQLDNSQSSILNEEEVEQVWTDNGDVDLKILKQLIQHKEEKLDRQKPKPGSKLTLFSHLVTRLEQTLEERHRVQAKLGQFRRLPEAEGRIRGNDDTVNNKTSMTSVFMVVQRFRSATLLINEDNAVRVGATTTSSFDDEESPKDKCCGMLVYVSFAKGATQAMVQAAGKIIVNLPILTFGAWGDGVSKNMNVLDLAVHQQNAASLVIVPQANLTCKVKNQGKSIQYHGQIDKSEGDEMYQYFVNYIRGLVLEHQCEIRNEPLPDWYQRSKSAQSGSSAQCAPPSTPPDELFQGTTLYRSWDDNGIPMTDAENQPITKSAQKRMRKAQAAHKVKYLKYLRDPTCASSSSSSKADESTEKSDSEQPPPLAKQQEANWTNAVDPSFVNIVAGTFGKRQSLEFFADMGPFCHVIQV